MPSAEFSPGLCMFAAIYAASFLFWRSTTRRVVSLGESPKPDDPNYPTWKASLDELKPLFNVSCRMAMIQRPACFLPFLMLMKGQVSADRGLPWFVHCVYLALLGLGSPALTWGDTFFDDLEKERWAAELQAEVKEKQRIADGGVHSIDLGVEAWKKTPAGKAASAAAAVVAAAADKAREEKSKAAIQPVAKMQSIKLPIIHNIVIGRFPACLSALMIEFYKFSMVMLQVADCYLDSMACCIAIHVGYAHSLAMVAVFLLCFIAQPCIMSGALREETPVMALLRDQEFTMTAEAKDVVALLFGGDPEFTMTAEAKDVAILVLFFTEQLPQLGFQADMAIEKEAGIAVWISIAVTCCLASKAVAIPLRKCAPVVGSGAVTWVGDTASFQPIASNA